MNPAQLIRSINRGWFGLPYASVPSVDLLQSLSLTDSALPDESGEWTELEELLKFFLAEEFAVIDANGICLLAIVVRILTDDAFAKVFYPEAVKTDGGRDLIRRLSALGLDLTTYSKRGGPLYRIMRADFGNFQCVVPLLLKLRLDPDQADLPEKFGNYVKAYSECVEHDLDAPPSVAQMVAEGDTWAVFNLIRRMVVSDVDVLKEYQGKNALQWAVEVGGENCSLACELRYRFRFGPTTASSSVTSTTQVAVAGAAAAGVAAAPPHGHSHRKGDIPEGIF